jgi:hypothetical protein
MKGYHRRLPAPGAAMMFALAAMWLLTATETAAAPVPAPVERLSTDLTPVGAKRAGNTAGTIPAWNGGLDNPPLPYEAGDHHPDPFAGETPRFRIDRSNLAEHEAFLSPGQAAMIRSYTGFHLNVFPTHRTAAFPERIYEMTARNAATGSLTDGGLAVTGVAEGFPFPFPESAEELIWNHRLRYKGTGSIRHISLVAPTAKGAFTEVTMTVTTTNPYYRPGATLESIDNRLLLFLQETHSPARLAGSVLLVHETVNDAAQPRNAWVYNPGQRRVIRAPHVAYDSPSAATDSMHVSDMTDMFNGALDRFSWTLVGKREMFVPYNAYRVHSGELDYSDLAVPGHLDPSYLRYELHRVWVVEARLREGFRHINPRRTYYLDEDSYQILMADHYDANGELWRYSEAHPINFYDVPTVWTTIEIHHDLQSRRFASYRLDPRKPVPPFNMDLDPREFTPQALRRMGRR